MARTRKPPVKRVRKIKEKKQPIDRKPTFISKLKNAVKKLVRPLKVVKKPFQNKFFRKVGNILRKVLLINYIASSWSEVRQVAWPDHKQTAKLTLAVFIFATVFGLFVAAVDFGLDKLFKEVIL